MHNPNRVTLLPLVPVFAAIAYLCVGVLAWPVRMLQAQAAASAAAQNAGEIPTPPPNSPAGANAYSCGVPATPPPNGRPQQAVFPKNQYPVLLPAASLSHMGVFATGQAYEQLVLHLLAHPLAEARCPPAMLEVDACPWRIEGSNPLLEAVTSLLGSGDRQALWRGQHLGCLLEQPGTREGV